SSEKIIFEKLSLIWGVKSLFYYIIVFTFDTVVDFKRFEKKNGFLNTNDYVVNLTSMPVEAKGMENTLRVSQIK
ncbi:pyruvate kinase alpha/beta domain-containing protein, partial [Polaribacter gochangensis]|uniref:pyruvate kinase alpha/beta domain-containing protein n=1 Tax=Polaribacter gochangensis TaxID=3252903 RepID=UPI003904679E